MKENTKKVNKTKDAVVETEVVNETVAVVEETETKSKEFMGVITGCSKLNIRKTPEVKNNNILKEVESGSKLSVIDDVKDFYKVALEDGTTGFAMKKYIK